MPMGTAEKHLRKAVIHELASQLGKNQCCRCGLEIEDPEDLAIVHVQDWEEDADLFWALTNVAFSHTRCEAARSGKRQREKKQMSKIEVRVEDPNGKSLPGTKHKGQLYVAGKKGARYQIRVRNKTNKNVLAVLTVDGRNVITGEPGDHHDNGHVLGPKQSWTFKGWRTSDDSVAAFEFGKKSNAYSSQMGSPENVGVIGVAVFEEFEPDPIIKTVKEYVPWPYPVTNPFVLPWPRNPWDIPNPIWYGTPEITCDSYGVAPASNTVGFSDGGGGGTFTSSSVSINNAVNKLSSSELQVEAASNPVKQQRLGTEWGEQLDSVVRSVEFKRATDDPCEVFVIRYDSLGALRERGIMVRPSERRQEAPQAFPKNQGYCQPPPRKRTHKG